MAKFAKSARRALKKATSAGRIALQERSPPWMKKRFGPYASYLDMVFLDHGFFRLAYLNLHRVDVDAWRSAQPAPHHVARLKRLGIKTILNLRGEELGSSYKLEEAACRKHGIELVSYRMRSRAAPTVEEVLGAREVLDRIAYPVLIHCKSGADRAGLMTALYLHFHKGLPISEAKAALSLKYGHFKQSDTGVLDAFLDSYLAASTTDAKSFVAWLTEDYDPSAVQARFRANKWANRLVNSILRRE